MENELDDTLSTLRRFFGRLRGIPDSTFHYAPSNLGNKVVEDSYKILFNLSFIFWKKWNFTLKLSCKLFSDIFLYNLVGNCAFFCQCNQPEFHMYHMHLELRWLFITIIYARTIYSESSNLRLEDLDSTLQLVVDDLVYVSLKMFERVSKILIKSSWNNLL